MLEQAFEEGLVTFIRDIPLQRPGLRIERPSALSAILTSQTHRSGGRRSRQRGRLMKSSDVCSVTAADLARI